VKKICDLSKPSYTQQQNTVVISLFESLKDKFGILQLKPCFKIVSGEIEWLRLFFRQILLSREFLESVGAPPHLHNGSIGAQEQSFIKRILN